MTAARAVPYVGFKLMADVDANSLKSCDPQSPQHTRRTQRKRLTILIAAGIGLVSAVWLVKYFWFTLPIGEGPAGPAVSSAAFDHAWSEREVVLLGIGDSVTAGFRATRGHSYFDRLVANPEDEFPDMTGRCLSDVFPNPKVRNVAVSGSASTQHLNEQLATLEPYPAKVLGLVVMTTGGNDLIHDYGRSPPREGAMFGATLGEARPWIEAFEVRIDTMIDRVEEVFPGGYRVFIANIYDPTDGVGDIERAGLPPWHDGAETLEAYNDIIAGCAAKRPNVQLVDIHDAFLGHGIHCTQPWQSHYRWADPHYWYFENLEDPNDRGYDAIRRLFLLEMIAVFQESG